MFFVVVEFFKKEVSQGLRDSEERISHLRRNNGK